MTLSNQITFINDLIKEDPDTTIRQYLEAVQEIDIIEKTQSDMKLIDAAKKQMVLDMAMTHKYEAIVTATGVSKSTICRIFKGAKIDQVERAEAIRAHQLEIEKEVWAKRISEPKPEKQFVRPPAEYSNSRPYDSIHQTQKLA